MQPVFLRRSEIDDQQWNALVGKSDQSVIYAFTFYLDSVCEDWIAFVCPSENGYRIVMPVPVRRKFGKLIVYQPLFCQYLGVFAEKKADLRYTREFVIALCAKFGYISSYHFSPDNFPAFLDPPDSISRCKLQIRHTHLLDLCRPYDEIEAGYSLDRKANLTRGRRMKWHILKSNNIHPLIYLFVQNHSRQIPGGVDHRAYSLLEHLFQNLQILNAAELFYAHLDDGRIRAGVLIASYNAKATYLFNAADEIGRRGNARTFLLDTYFKKYAGDLATFDFESPEKNSISRHYESFGAIPNPFTCISQNRLPFPLKQIQQIRKAIFKTR